MTNVDVTVEVHVQFPLRNTRIFVDYANCFRATSPFCLIVKRSSKIATSAEAKQISFNNLHSLLTFAHIVRVLSNSVIIIYHN